MHEACSTPLPALASRPPQGRRLSILEYTALMAMMAALGALSIDTMLPGLGLIGAELSPDAPERALLVIGAFFLGLGVGTFVTGPLCDAYGRKPVVLGGIGLYCLGCVLAGLAQSLEVLLAARVLQGLGVAGPRVASMAITRDLFSGRQMASVVSLTMTIFAVVPAVAPFVGSAILAVSGWRAIFWVFIGFALFAGAWFWLRQPETNTQRRPVRPALLWAGAREVLSLAQVRATIVALSLTFSMLFVTLSTAHHVFEAHFHLGDQFASWFAVIGLLAAFASFFNSRIVLRIGMRRVVALSLGTQAGLSLVMAQVFAVAGSGPLVFTAYAGWLVSVFVTTSFCIGNLNALGLEPLGRLAGIGSSIISACSTLVAVLVSTLVSFAFDGTPLVPAIAIALCALAGLGALCLSRAQPATDLACLARS